MGRGSCESKHVRSRQPARRNGCGLGSVGCPECVGGTWGHWAAAVAAPQPAVGVVVPRGRFKCPVAAHSRRVRRPPPAVQRPPPRAAAPPTARARAARNWRPAPGALGPGRIDAWAGAGPRVLGKSQSEGLGAGAFVRTTWVLRARAHDRLPSDQRSQNSIARGGGGHEQALDGCGGRGERLDRGKRHRGRSSTRIKDVATSGPAAATSNKSSEVHPAEGGGFMVSSDWLDGWTGSTDRHRIAKSCREREQFRPRSRDLSISGELFFALPAGVLRLGLAPTPRLIGSIELNRIESLMELPFKSNRHNTGRQAFCPPRKRNGFEQRTQPNPSLPLSPLEYV